MDGDTILWIAIIVIVFFIGFNFIAVWLWGAIAVAVFGLPTLNFWQMLGLRVLINLILPSTIRRKD